MYRHYTESRDQRWTISCKLQLLHQQVCTEMFLPVECRLTEDVLFGQTFCSCELHQLLHHLKLPVITCPVYKVQICTATPAALKHTHTSTHSPGLRKHTAVKATVCTDQRTAVKTRTLTLLKINIKDIVNDIFII